MTILVAYVPRPEGQAALEKGIELALASKENLIVVNATPGGTGEDPSRADAQDVERVEQLISVSGIKAEFKQFVRGKNAVEELNDLVAAHSVSMLVIGLRKRTAVGKLIMGSMAQEILMTVECPILAVKAN
ncbi:universal stress protein UspA [Rhodoferax lacus]|uniref:Universal stress protein UspA n=1 Tax=Rhodoferax lacus TaxID=2184758 RepID=A0A3E1RDA9_9BURK|nr:universal stress protein [Rhodoferax lacus]RFO97356.1 universal stress protein UspA [Rhodoferax lacus]